MPYAVDYSSVEENRFEFSSMSPRISEGDELLFFSTLSGSGVQFLGRALVTGIEVEETGPKKKYRTVFVGELAKFEQPRELAALAGSLSTVKDFLNADSHFVDKQMVRISKADFQTIVEYELDVSRSVFRFLFSALPTAVKAEFVRIYVDQISEDGITIRSYEKPALLLLDFLETRVAEPLKLLKQIHDDHQQLSETTKIPKLSALVLCEANDRERHFLGDRCVAAAKLLDVEDTPRGFGLLFGSDEESTAKRDGNRFGLSLSECRAQIKENPTRRREWNEAIF